MFLTDIGILSAPNIKYIPKEIQILEIIRLKLRGLVKPVYSGGFKMIHATKMDFVTEGTKAEMHLWQHEMIENYAYKGKSY